MRAEVHSGGCELGLAMDVVFVHGYSVRNTATYGELPTRIEQEMARRGQEVRTDHIYLGKYVSFNDSVTLDDLSRAMDAAVREKGLKRFACITHSTGGPLVRNYMARYDSTAVSHLVMLAPANHGSALAQLGKGRLGRIKAFFESVEPGQRVLDWLELGSEEQWMLNLKWIERGAMDRGTWPFVLTGETIDPKLYDHLNSYTGEPGSDGVVRVAAANLNYDYVRLEQSRESGELKPVAWKRSEATALGIVDGRSHGGAERGIMNSVQLMGHHPTVDAVLKCLLVRNQADYEAICDEFHQTPARSRYSMLVFRVVDDEGQPVEDYDLLFTAGNNASPDALPKGFFRDRQRNKKSPHRLTYYLDHSRMAGIPIGIEVLARPDAGLVRYERAFIPPSDLGAVLRPHETMMVEIVLRRKVDRACFVLDADRRPNSISGEPTGEICQ
jgi:pimeloyl-ACP methyl ester carboxylesterase